MTTGPLNSSVPTASSVIGGVFNVIAPAPIPGQASALQLDASGNLLVNIAAGGGASGTQYVDGVTQVTPTGTVALGKNPTNVLHSLSLDSSGNLNVNLAAGTISGGNAAASPTGAAVPASADYLGVNIAGNLVGVTGFSLTNSKAVAIAIVDSNGNQITSFGGGIQFADNAASGATPTGTLSMGWDSINSKVRALKVDASQDLFVAFSSAQHIIVDSGSLTANIGTTGGLALDSTVSTVQPRRIQDGVGATLATVTGANALKIDGSAVTQPVSGTISVTGFANPLPVSQSGNWNINQVIGVAGFGKITDGTNTAAVTAASALKIDGSAVTQPVSGTFFQVTQPVSIAATVNVSVQNASLSVTQGTSPWVTTDATIGSNNQNPSPTSSSLVGFINNSNSEFLPLSGYGSGGVNALAITIVDGGGVQLAVGDNSTPPDVIPVGFSMMGYDPIANKVRALTVDSSQNLKIAGNITASNPAVGLTGSSVPLQASYTAVKDIGGNLTGMSLDSLGRLQVTILDSTQTTDLLHMVVAQLRILNMNFAANMPGSFVDQDTQSIDMFTIN